MYGSQLFNSSDILLEANQLEIWQMILGQPVGIGEFISSPFRGDNTPRCYLRRYNNLVLFTDWAFPEYNKYTIVHAVAHFKGIAYKEAKSLIAGLVKYNIPILNVRGNIIRTHHKVSFTQDRKQLSFEPFFNNGQIAYTTEDVKYWAKRSITLDELRDAEQPCISIHRYWLNGFPVHPQSYPCYALAVRNSSNYKIYCPNNQKDRRFPVSSTTKEDVWSWISDSTTAVLTKSYKDGLLAHKLSKLDTYAFQNEGVIPSDLSFLEKYTRTILVYDNDEAGYNAATKLKDKLPGTVKLLFYPRELGKDTDDLVVNGHSDIAKELLLENIV
jgi:hypothetical protein